MIQERVVADVGHSFFCLYDLVINQFLDLIFQSLELANGVPLHTGMVCTRLVGVDPLRWTLHCHSRNRNEITSGLQPFIKLVDGFSNSSVLSR